MDESRDECLGETSEGKKEKENIYEKNSAKRSGTWQEQQVKMLDLKNAATWADVLL